MLAVEIITTRAQGKGRHNKNESLKREGEDLICARARRVGDTNSLVEHLNYGYWNR